MSAAASGLVGPWGDRTYLLPKEMGYVMSLYARATANGSYLMVAPQDGALRHLFGDREVTMPDGLRCDLPVGDLANGSGEIGSTVNPASAALRLQLQIDLNAAEKLLMDCRGVVNFDGGPEAFRTLRAGALTGRAFLATRHQTDSPTFRWFNRRQLFGIGRVRGVKGTLPRELEFSFDFYASA
jgi:hypothetical protein